MRILVVSNFYPPHFIGGYELGCCRVVEALEARGHQVAVLTSTHGVARPRQDGNIYRWLHTTYDAFPQIRDFGAYRLRLLSQEWRNQTALDAACRRYEPDVVYVWNLGWLPISLALLAEARAPVCYYVSDDWLARSLDDPWQQVMKLSVSHLRGRLGWRVIRAVFKARRLVMAPGRPALRHVQFCSGFLKQRTVEAGHAVADAEVVYWGVDPDRFRPPHAPARPQDHDKRRGRLLYVGQIVAHKGVHTALAAVELLRDRGVRDVTLTIVGGSVAPDYVASLHRQLARSRLGEAVRFAGVVPPDRLPDLYREHGILLFPSCWDEPFAITPLEAMASGLVVIGTTRGGSREIFEHNGNALTFPEEDARECADQIERVLSDPRLYRSLAARARCTVVERFTFQRMVDRLEARLEIARHCAT